MNQSSGAEIVMASLVRQGVGTIFGYPGGVVLPLYDEMLNWPQVKHILVRHEQCAAHMADGYARATGKVGVCLATSGPGATNLVTGIATAMMDSIPMVALTGNVNSWAIGTDAFQETDIQGITIPITKHNYLVQNIEDLPHVLEEAFYLANTGRKGPVLVDIPKDVFTALTTADFPDEVQRRGYKPSAELNLLSFQRAAHLLREAKKPIVIAGAGVIWSDTSDVLRELAEKCDLPVISTLLGLGNIDRSDPRSLGMMGMHGEYVGTRAVQEADLVIGIGMRWDDRLTGKVNGFAPKAKFPSSSLASSQRQTQNGGSKFVNGNEQTQSSFPKTKSSLHATSSTNSTNYPRARPTSAPTLDSTRCGRHNSTSSSDPINGCPAVDSEPWALAFPLQWARHSLILAKKSGQLSAMEDSR